MKDLKKLVERAKEELDVIDVPYGRIGKITVNNRAKNRWGQCTRIGDTYDIDISVELLQDYVTDESTLDTIIHELIHTCPNCMNHGDEWLKWANLVNDCYACYNIKRCSSCADKGVKEEIMYKNYNWIFGCPRCDKEWKYQRQPKWAKDYDPIREEMTNGSCPYCHHNVKLIKGNRAKLRHSYSF